MSSQRNDWRERLHADPSLMEQELAIKLQNNGISYQTKVEILVTMVDFYLPLEPRPIDRLRRRAGPPQNKPDDKRRRNTHTTTKETIKNLELSYSGYSVKKRDQLYEEILNSLGKEKLG